MNLSIVVPVWNEAPGIDAFVRHLRARFPHAEIVIVDGESDDETWPRLEKLREELRLQLLRGRRGRADQMNAGAEAAVGDVLLFLHADSRLPAGAANAIADLFRDPRICGGCFQLRFARPEPIYRISDSLGNVAVDLFQIAFGDHGIFCRRDAFFRAGGFPRVPLMEDADFYRALKRQGRVRQLRAKIQTSPRRYEEVGPGRTTLFYLLILGLYLTGTDRHRLARLHRRLIGGTPRPADASEEVPAKTSQSALPSALQSRTTRPFL